MSGFEENPFGEPTIDNPFAVSLKKFMKCHLFPTNTIKMLCINCSDLLILG